jgi:hypothetical protein
VMSDYNEEAKQQHPQAQASGGHEPPARRAT